MAELLTVQGFMLHSTGFENEFPPLQVVEEVMVMRRAGGDAFEEHVEDSLPHDHPGIPPFCLLPPSVCTPLRHPKVVIKALTVQ